MMIPKRPKKLESKTVQLPCPCGKIYVHITYMNGVPHEIFSRLGKSGGCGAAVTGAMTNTLSAALKAGVPVADLAKGLAGISCHRPPALDGGKNILSCADAIGQVLNNIT